MKKTICLMALCLCTMMISSCGDNIDELEGNEITGYKSDDGGFIFRLFEDNSSVCLYRCLPEKAKENMIVPEKVKIDGAMYEVTALVGGDYGTTFDGCGIIKSLSIPSIRGLYPTQLFGCPNLQTINLGKHIEYCSPLCLNMLIQLKKINVDKDNPCFSSIDGILFNKNKDSLLICPAGLTGNYEIPNSVKTLSHNSFMNTGLNSIVIPESVVNIDKWAITHAKNLTEITNLATSPQEINDDASTIYKYYVGSEEHIRTLRVQRGCKETYAAHPVWGKFNIVEI